MYQLYLIARREYLAYVAAPGFWVSLLFMPIVFSVLVFAPALLARTEPPRAIAIIADLPADAAALEAAFEQDAYGDARYEIAAFVSAAAPSAAEAALAAFDAETDRAAAIAAARAVVRERAPNVAPAFPSPQPTYRVLVPPADTIEGLKPYLIGERAPELFGALYIAHQPEANGAARRIEYWSAKLTQTDPMDTARRIMRRELRREALAERGVGAEDAAIIEQLDLSARQFDPRAAASEDAAVSVRQRAPIVAALAMTFILWGMVFSVANMLLSGVIEERANKILDTVLTSVSPLTLLVGKLLGVACVSATLLIVWGGVGGALTGFAAAHTPDSFIGQAAAALADPRLLAAFGVGFVFGYLMYGAIFLALGSLCETMQEAQTLLGPVAIVLALPMMLIGPALFNPDAPAIVIASWVPLFTPFLLLVRAPTDLTWPELAGLTLVMAIATMLVLRFAARVFRAGVVDGANFAALRQRLFRGKQKA